MEDGFILVVATVLDIALTRGAKRHIWIRVVGTIFGLLFLALIGVVVYITFVQILVSSVR